MSTDTIDLYKVLNERLVDCPTDLGGGSYLPPSVLDQYVQEPHITACWDESVDENLSVTIDTSARKIFTILLLANRIEIVGDLLGCGIRDQHLPLSLDQSKDRLVSCCGTVFQPSSSPWPKRLRREIEAFLKKQWIVDPPILDDSGEHYTFDSNRALPFLDRLEALGSPAKEVFDCTIHPGHFRSVDDMTRPLQDNGDAVPEWQTSGRRVAVKKFTKREDFDREMTALRAARNEKHPRLIRYLSTCEKSNTYYILLPWADGSTLNRFWENNGPKTSPRNRELIRESLDQLLQLSDALRFLHSLNFRHGDLKPDNILHFTSPSGQADNFVIADLGISRHHHLATGLRNVATMTKSTTAAYEAPEVFTDAASRQARPRRYDVWSMGCIILEYIIWLLWDSEAIEAFAAAREYPAFAFYLAKRDSVGEKIAVVHPEVEAAIEVLRADPRCARGTALRDLVDLVERKLLVVDMDRRCEATELYAAVNDIVRKASATGDGMGDTYVLPLEAKAPVTRPGIFQPKEAPSGVGVPRTRQSSIALSRVGSWSTSTTTTITTMTSHFFSLPRNDSIGSIRNSGQGKTYHRDAPIVSPISSDNAAPLALVTVAPEKASLWTVFVRSRSVVTDAGGRDRGSIATRLREYFAQRREETYAKLRLWRER